MVETNYDLLFENLLGLRNLTLSLVLLLLAVMGFVAWLITRGILRPLDTLKKSAEIVAAGDMDIKLPVSSRDELGIATMAFNQMIEMVKQSFFQIVSVWVPGEDIAAIKLEDFEA